MSNQKELVTLTIDGVEVTVPKGTNLIEAARLAGSAVPYYCYHPHLSIAGNCRMCQVKVEGSPKLTIACNTGAAAGMVVRTQVTAADVAEAQRATLEFLLINHPLDCTVCDQAGHCKLQDYYYEYNGQASRFIEDKVEKVKAEPVGPEVIYDGERCIVCTRCVRFCQEVTETSELGVFNRGDRAVIGIHEGKELTNPLSGSVVDLCPVGALTHRRWRFNTRIWYTQDVESICPGCSTGCNAKVNTRDGRVVQVKARLNANVNQEWMCDEGRYGFERFEPTKRLAAPHRRESTSYHAISWDELGEQLGKFGQVGGGAATAVFLSPFLTLEETWVAMEFARVVLGVNAGEGQIAVQLKTRSLTKEEAKLISPDFAPNARALEVLSGVALGGDWRESCEARYRALLDFVRGGKAKNILLVGDYAVSDADGDGKFCSALAQAELSIALTPRAPTLSGPHIGAQVLLPSRTINEKGGVLINRDLRLQRLQALFQAPIGSQPEWLLLSRVAQLLRKPILSSGVTDERSLFREVVNKSPRLKGLTLARIGLTGVRLDEIAQGGVGGEQSLSATV